MGYFRELPNLAYQSFLSDSNSSQNYLIVKNFFRRCRFRDDLQNVFTIFDKYEIPEGSRPDTVAEEFYGDSQLDWVVTMTAGIINVRDEWPLSNKNLYEYAFKLHGNNLNEIHHYETKEIKDSKNNIILPSGKVVNGGNNNSTKFKIYYTDNNKTYTNDTEHTTSEKIADPFIGISNWEYEVRKNDKKSLIYLLKRSYLQQFLNDMRIEMTYSTSSQYITENLARTENTRVTSP